MIEFEKLIMEARKAGDRDRAMAYQNLKAEKQKIITAKNAPEYTEAVELKMVQKYADGLKNAIKEFETAGREDLVEDYGREYAYIKPFLPEPVSEKKIEGLVFGYANENGYIDSYVDNGKDCPMEGYTIKIPKNKMGECIKKVKEQVPTADGKVISNIVKKYLE